MADPFDVLRALDEPVEPDRAFADRLRDRLARALVLPKGVTVSELTLDLPTESRAGAPPAPVAGLASITLYLSVAGAADAISWYGEALGARLAAEPIVMPDGRIGHAELDLGGARFFLSEEHPEIGIVAPEPGGGVTFTAYLSVEDVDAVLDRAVGAGAVLERAAADYDYGRNGVIRDPFGHRWMVASEPSAPAGTAAGASGFRHGDIGYVSLWVPDVARAASFFGAVLGWSFDPVPDERAPGRRVTGQRLHHGLWGGVEDPTLFCCYAVDDVDLAADRIRAAGGVASEATEEPYGRVVEATDPMGVRFAVFTPPGGTAPKGSRPDPSSQPASRQGDVAYVTMEVSDSSTTRAFYGHVLGWHTTPGRVVDGWNVEQVEPMIGIAGSQPRVRCVPMYRVDDIEAAVHRVRAAGGQATDPEVQPYGTTSDATDDQGTRFYLGQLT
ncbi:MAG: VOC family protein [Acidimicrobiales bacterium]|nr:VOC family protein [Acidimicrobiales bacterium]